MRWEMHGGYAEDIGSAFKSLFGNPPLTKKILLRKHIQ